MISIVSASSCINNHIARSRIISCEKPRALSRKRNIEPYRRKRNQHQAKGSERRKNEKREMKRRKRSAGDIKENQRCPEQNIRRAS